MAVDARRNAVRVTDEEKKLLDLARTAEPLPPSVSDALLRLVEHARNGGALLRADTDAAAPAPKAPAGFKVGDVVCLKSDGGLQMTVIGIGPDCDEGDQVVTVAWASFPGPDLRTRNLPPAALRQASDGMAAFD